jgi:L-rhamnose isomerase
MDAEFDEISTIKNLTVNNLSEISFKDMLAILEPLVLAKVPEGNSTDKNAERQRLDYLLARLANLFAYLRYLWSSASYQRARFKYSDDAKADEMLKKKEALYELGNAVKLKYEAVSRRITVALDDERDMPERANHTARVERMEKRSSWDSVP